MIMRAKSYMDMLSNGIDPISGNDVPEDTVLGQERLRRCFAFVSEILEEAVTNYGLIHLPENEKNAAYEVTRKKAAFSIQAIPRQNVYISAEPVNTTAFVKNVNAVVNKDDMEKFSMKELNQWLTACGYLVESKEPKVMNRTVRHVTPDASRVGIIERQVVDQKTGEVKLEVVFTREAQMFILNHFGEN